jgi:outer membrane receptor for ferrienterochelin and colicin
MPTLTRRSCEDCAASVQSSAGVPATYYFDLNASYKVTEYVRVRGGITNLTNQAPRYNNTTLGTDPTTYDVYGRSFFVAVSAKF